MNAPRIDECRYCGCTEHDPCLMRDGLGRIRGCAWLDPEHSVCDAPSCVAMLGLDGVELALTQFPTICRIVNSMLVKEQRVELAR